MSHDFAFPPQNTQVNHAPRWVPRQQISAAASSASSPGRRTGALRAPDTPARGNPDTFTHQGTAYVLIRFYPGTQKSEPLEHHSAAAEIPIQGGTVHLPVTITARTPHLVHVTWIDDTGEIMGTWCPTSMVRTEREPKEPGEYEHG